MEWDLDVGRGDGDGDIGWRRRGDGTDRQRAPKRIIIETWKRFESPTAKQRNMQITPVLPFVSH